MQTLIDHRRIGDIPVLEFYNPQVSGRLPLIIVMHGFTGRKEDSFQVAIIPYTYEHTNFQTFKKGSVINLEFDIIGKYLSRLVSFN